jgi:hypothetical protein
MVALTLTLLWAGPGLNRASAVVDGAPDTENAYPYVAGVEYEFAEGIWGVQCSGTLIAPNLVLTAAHCGGFPGAGPLPASVIRVNFNPQTSFPSDPSDPQAYLVDEVILHPAFLSAQPAGGNSKTSLASPWEDIALLRLSAPVQGIAPAPLAPAGYLDQLELGGEQFTTVGYGILGFTKGSASTLVGWANFVGPEYRTFRTVAALGHDAYPERYLKISAANCFGDSGGPLLHDGTVVAITIWTNSNRCEGPGLDYRVDSPIAQAFLADHLP